MYLYASSKIFLICMHFADSVKPTMSSGLQILTNGKPDILASLAAKAVLPAFGVPSNRILTNPSMSKFIKLEDII